MPMNVKVSGSWRDVTPYVKVSGSWRSIDKAWVKVAGTWRVIYESLSIEYTGFGGGTIRKYDIDGNTIESLGNISFPFDGSRKFVMDDQNRVYYCTDNSTVIKYNFNTSTTEWTYTVPNSNNASEIIVDSNYNVYFGELNNDVITKLDSSGNVQWQRDISPYSINGYGVTILDNDDLVYYAYDAGNQNEYLERITPNNNRVWITTSVPSNSITTINVLENDVDRAFGISNDASIIDINLNDGSVSTLFNASEVGAFPNDFHVDDVNSRIYISAVSSFSPDPSASDEGLFSYDFNGNIQWNRNVASQSVIADPNGNVVYGTNNDELTKIDLNENVIWSKSISTNELHNVPINTLIY